MAFQGLNFIYDGKPSEQYDLCLIYNGSGETTSSAGSNVSLLTDKILRSPRTQLLGTEQEPLTFDVEFASKSPMDRYKLSAIHTWLFGHSGYKQFHICQTDMKKFYYNCIFTDPEDVYYDNYPYAFRCKVICDAPWAWEFPVTKEFSFPTSYYNHIQLLTPSNDNEKIMPVVEFTLTPSNTNFIIINHSYRDLRFEWRGLLGGETIRVDNETQIISSSTRLRRIDKFNKNFLRLIHGMNQLECIGTVSKLKITYESARKVGA